MNLEDVMLSERSWSQKEKYYMIPLSRGVSSQSESQVEWRPPGLRGERGGEVVFHWYRTYFLLSFVVYALLSNQKNGNYLKYPPFFYFQNIKIG